MIRRRDVESPAFRRFSWLHAIGCALLVSCGGSGGGTSDQINPAVSPTLSTVSIGTSAVADGSTSVTATVTVLDGAGKPLGGVKVTFAATGRNNTWSPAFATTDSSGVAKAQLTSTTAETKTISASAGGVALAQTCSVTFAAPPKSGSTQVCAAGGTIAQSGVSLTVPPGALATCQTITLTVGGALPSGYTSYSALVTLEPATLTFSSPATLTIPFTGDTTKARLFWSLATGTGWERQSSPSTGTTLSTTVSHLGAGFVADGVVYADPPDRSCVKTRLIKGATTTPATVALAFTVDDCQGRPITNLMCASYPGTCDFVLKENGVALSSEASAVILPRSGLQVFMSLVIDMSSSTAANLQTVIDGAKAFVQTLQSDLGLPVQISIQLFAGEATLTEWQKPTLDTATLIRRLDQLGSFAPADQSSTNLNGALVAALERQATYKTAFDNRNFGGALTAGYVVVFTDGRDTAGRVTAASVQSAEAANPDDVLGVALETQDLDLAALRAIAPSGVFSGTADSFTSEFKALASSRISGQIQRTYLLGYCSPARAGTPTVSVEVKNATASATAQYAFGASGFAGGCSAASILHRCDGAQCGGFGCGACDDRVAACDGASRKCIDYCIAHDWCGGYSFTNPNGYAQVCGDVPTHNACGAVCVDLTSDESNCGACGIVCQAGGGQCGSGVCSCPAALTDCGGACFDTRTDMANCGACGIGCPLGGACEAGACACPGEQIACAGACRELASDPLNCGACGIACTGNRFCDVGTCSCPSGTAACGSACESLATSQHCGSCGNLCGAGQLCGSTAACVPGCRNTHGTFQARVDYATGTYPWSIAVGDLNRDGKPDLVTGNYGDSTASVLLGNGDGTFTAKVDYATGIWPVSIALGDVNGDGNSDLVTANYSGTVSVLLGNGNGTFKPKADYATGANPRSVALGDVNGDGKPDLVTANYGANTVSVFLGNGDGTFRAKMDFATSASPRSVALGDVNGDSKPDVVTSGGVLSVLLGNGNGTFQANVDYAVGGITSGVAIGDVNGDGNLDVVTANTNDTASVLLGNGDGTFKPHVDYPATDWSGSPNFVALGDLNGDGTPDLVTANYKSSGTVSVLFGNGDGTFRGYEEHSTGTTTYAVALGDLNGDRNLDIVAANYGANSVSVLLGSGGGTFQSKTDYVTGPSPSVVATGDLNGDGKLDAVTAHSAGSLNVLLGRGDGTFGGTVTYSAEPGARVVAITDVNGDRMLDAVTANGGSNTVSVFLGNGNGTFRPKVDYGTGVGPVSLAIGDVNKDGKPDLVTANNNAGSVSVLLGNGDGTFQARVDYNIGAPTYYVALGDLNGDGKPDVATANYGTGVSVLRGNGDGTFQGKVNYATGTATTYTVFVGIGDVNGDGIPDLLATNSVESILTVRLGNGDGTFKAKADYAAATSPGSGALVDLNGDGKLDVVTVNGNNIVSVLHGSGDGTFRSHVDFVTGARPSSVAIGDVNGDGRPDLVSANQGESTLSVLIGECL